MSKMRRIVLVSAVVVMLVVLALPAAASAAASAAPSMTAGGSGCAVFHKVKPGENLFRIAMRYGTTVHKLAALNGISNPDFIVAGTTLCVKPAKAPPKDDDGFWYTVKKGDTLGNIGSRYGWGALTLARVNGIKNPDKIYPGQKLWIPDHD